MELEVGVKITKTRDDITSVSEFRVAKDRAGPVFLSRETDTMFILTAHLTGYKKENIDIKINEDGTEIFISGEKPVQEMLMVRWIMLKKEVEIKGFRKVFKIPHGVILDRIKAKYNQEESVFKIVMPKLVKGISGVRIEEVKEEGGSRRRLELDQPSEAEAGQTSNSIGETRKEVSPECEIQKIEETQSVGEKMPAEATGETIQKEIEESMIEIENKGGESVRQKVSNEGFRFSDMKRSALDQSIADHMPKKNGQTSQQVPKLSGIQETEKAIKKIEGRESEKMLVEGGNGVIKGDLIGGKQDTREEGMKVTELDQNVADPIPRIIDEANKEATLEKTGKSERTLVEANAVIAENKETQIESEGKSKEHGREVGKGGYEPMKTRMEDFPQQAPETPVEGHVGSETEELSASTMEVQSRVPHESAKPSMEQKILERRKPMHVQAADSEMPLEATVIHAKASNIEFKKVELKGDSDKEGKKELTSPFVEKLREEPCELTKRREDTSKAEILSQVQKRKELIHSLQGTKASKARPDEVDEPSKLSSPPSTQFEVKETGKIEECCEDRHQEPRESEKQGSKMKAYQDVEQMETSKPVFPTDQLFIKEDQQVIGEEKSHGRHEIEESMKGTELDKTVADHIPSNIDETKKETTSEKTGEPERTLFESNEVIVEKKETQIESEDISKGHGREVAKGGFEPMKTSMEEFPHQEFPKKVEEMLLDGSKGFKVTKMQETEEIPEAIARKKIKEGECFMDKVEGDLESKKMHTEAIEVAEKNKSRQTFQKEIEESKIKTTGNQQDLRENIVKGAFEIEDTISKVKEEEGSEKMHVEGLRDFEQDMVKETIQKETTEPRIATKDSDQVSRQENVDKGGFDVMETLRKMFPKQAAEILPDGSKGSKATNGEGTKQVKEESSKTESPVEKLRGDKIELIHVKTEGDFKEDITKETTKKEIQEAKLETEDRDQQYVQEGISKGSFEARGTATDEFSQQIAESSLVEEREGSKVTRLEETKKVKEVGKSGETEDVAEDEESVMERETLQEAPDTKYPTRSEKGTPEREVQHTKEIAPYPKVARMGFDEVELGNSKDKSKHKKLPQVIQSKSTHVSEQQSVNQDILRVKKAKEVEGEQSLVGSVADQTAKPFPVPSRPSTQQSQVEETEVPNIDSDNVAQQSAQKELDHIGEIGRKETIGKELPKQDYIANVKDDKPQRKEEIQEPDGENVDESGRKETIGKKLPKQEYIAHVKEEKIQELYGEEVDETRRQETIGKEVQKQDYIADVKDEKPRRTEAIQERDGEKVNESERQEAIGKEQPNEDYISDVKDEKPRRKEAIQELDVEKVDESGRQEAIGKEQPKQNYTADVKDEKPRMKEEIKELDGEKDDESKVVEETMPTTPDKEKHRKSEVVDKDSEPPEAAATHPELTSMKFKEIDPKTDIEEPPRKELLPPGVEMQSKESLEPERSSKKFNFPTTTRYMPEVKERKRYQTAKGSEVQSIASTEQPIVEEKGKPDKGIEAKDEASKESLEQKSEIYFQGSNEGKIPSEDEKKDILQCLEEKQKGDGNNSGKKSFEKKVAEEELLKRERGAETLLEKSEWPKTEEIEETSQQSLRERARTKTTEQDKKAKVIKMSETMQGSPEKESLRESARTTLEIGEKPLKATATHPKATTEEFEDVKANNENGKSQAEELSAPTTEVQRRVPRESAKPSMEQKIMERKGVRQETERRKPMHVQAAGNEVLEAESPNREVEPLQATIIDSKATIIEFKKVEPKVGSDKEGAEEPTSPFVEKLREEAYELAKPTMKQDTSKAEILQQVHKGKRLIHSLQGTKVSKARPDELDEPSKLSSASSTQQFGVKGKGKTEECCEDRQQESQESQKKESKMKADEDAEQTETSKPEFPTDQQFIKDDQQVIGEEQSHGRHEIEEGMKEKELDKMVADHIPSNIDETNKEETLEKTGESETMLSETNEVIAEMKADQDFEQIETSKPDFRTDQKGDQQVIGEEESQGRHELVEETAKEQGDEASKDNLQESVEQRDLKAKASGKKKDDKKSSNKFFAPLIVAGSAFLISIIVLFISHKRRSQNLNKRGAEINRGEKSINNMQIVLRKKLEIVRYSGHDSMDMLSKGYSCSIGKKTPGI